MRIRITLLLALIAAGGCAAMQDVRIPPTPNAPPPPPPLALFADLQTLVRVNDRVEVRAGGRKVKGALVELSAEGLVVRRRKERVRFACDEIDRVDKMGDPVDEGGTIGVLLGIFPALCTCATMACAAVPVAIFGGIGALLDMAAGGGPRPVYVRSPSSGCGSSGSG